MIIYYAVQAVLMVAGFILALIPDFPTDILVETGVLSEYMTVMVEYIKTGVGIFRYIYGSRLLDFTFLFAGVLIVFDIGMVIFRFIIGKFFMN